MNINLPRSTKTILLAVGSITVALAVFTSVAFASLTDNFFGYAWSSNIGWIKMNNCFSPTDCTGPVTDPSGNVGFGIKMAPSGATRALTGYAWSSNIGWITFNTGSLTIYNPATDGPTMLDHCPPSPSFPGTSCGPYVLWGANGGPMVPLKGWARACSMYISGCSGPTKDTSATGAWDGWIALGDTNTTDAATYGVTMNTANGALTGYGWGSAIVGWVNFSDVKVEDPVMCPDGTTPPVAGDITSCSQCQGPNPLPSCNVCPWDGVPVNGVCPTTHTCPDGTVMPTSQQCPNTTCVDGSVPINGYCPSTPTTCPDGSTPVGGVCPSTGTTCPDGSTPVNGVCPPPTQTCPDGSVIPVGQQCPSTTCPDGSEQVNGVCPTGGPTGGQCSNIPDAIELTLGILPPPAVVVPPYQHLPDGRCVCAVNGYILNAHYICVKPVYTEQ